MRTARATEYWLHDEYDDTNKDEEMQFLTSGFALRKWRLKWCIYVHMHLFIKILYETLCGAIYRET